MRYGNDTKQLREDLKIVPNISAGAFELTMSTRRTAMESYTLVKAAQHVFLEHLKEDAAGEKDTRRTGLQRVLQKEEDNFKVNSDALSSGRRRRTSTCSGRNSKLKRSH